jgi:fatty acid desaturase
MGGSGAGRVDEATPRDGPRPIHEWHWRRRAFPLWGLFIFAFGVFWLGGVAGWWSFDSKYVWPLVVVFFGLSIMIGWATRRHW